MNKDWQAAAAADGGKHRKGVERTHAALAAEKTPHDREVALKAHLVGDLVGMIAAGATLQELFDAIQHVANGRAVLTAAVEHGV